MSRPIDSSALRASSRFGTSRLSQFKPARPWTVGSLANEIGMSRTRFAEQFREMIGTSPVSYLTDWRFQRATAALSTGRQPISEIARECGYSSPAAFTRAFNERFGRTPKAFRRDGDG